MIRTILLGVFVALAQSTDPQTKLELAKIMAGNDFVGYSPEAIQWSPQSNAIYFRWRKNGEPVAPHYVYDLDKRSYRKLEPSETHDLPVDGFHKTPGGTAAFFKRDHRLFSLNAGFRSMIYDKISDYWWIHSVIDNKRLVIQERNQLYFMCTSPFQFRQISWFEPGKAPADATDSSFLALQQVELFEFVRLNEMRDSSREEHTKAHEPKITRPFYLDKKELGPVIISLNQKNIAFRCDQYPENKSTHIEQYVNQDGFSKSISAREKVGAADPDHRTWIWKTDKDTALMVDFNGLTGIRLRPLYFKDYETDFKAESEKPKNVLPHLKGFNYAGNKVLIEVHSYDNKDRWICYYDLESDMLIEVDHQHDEAWIGGPGISEWRSEGGNVGWIGNDTIYFQSEVSGYSHLYLYDIRQNKTTQLTAGKFEIHGAQLSRNRAKFFVTANKTHPGNRDFYVLDVKTNKLIPVLTGDGNHEVSVSPDEKWLAVRYSTGSQPWELYVAPLKENTQLTRVTQSTRYEFLAYSWRKPELVEITARDGVKLYARLYRPNAQVKTGAGVIFVHGAGYLQNAHNWWSNYFREYMFHNLLCDLGYTVLDIDYRASEGYGRDFRTGIYRHMGGKDLDDQLDGRKYLIEKEGVDSNRVGIYGGSYGGFITLMALLTQPATFKCGAALRSVTDWAHYNHPYTSNILNTPETDPDAFRKSSPVYFAENLRDRLVMLHGVEDDNVQYQDVIRLSQRFIELGKTNWDLVSFPVEPHGFRETSSWTEEYRRILEMFETELRE